MRSLVAAVALTAMLGTGGAQAQTRLDHDVQRTWDNVFDPPPRGDPRTNWERRRDNAHARQRREAARQAAFCRARPSACRRY